MLQQPKCWNPTDAAPVLLSQLALLEQVSLPQGGDAVEVRLGLLVKNDEAYQQRCASHLHYAFARLKVSPDWVLVLAFFLLREIVATCECG